MTNSEAKAVCALLHALLEEKRLAFYAFTRAIGYSLDGTSELDTVCYEREPHVTRRAILFFRAVANGLENGPFSDIVKQDKE